MIKKFISWLKCESSEKDWEEFRPLSQAIGELLDIETRQFERLAKEKNNVKN